MATETLRPDAAGSETSFPTQYPDEDNHYDKVDEAVADDDTTYVIDDRAVCDASYVRDLYTFPSSSGLGTINSVTLHMRIKVGSNGFQEQEISCRTHATVYDYAVSPCNSGSYEEEEKELAVNPNTSNAWTWDEVDALEAGPRLRTCNAHTARCTQFWVEVDYTPAYQPRPAGMASGTTQIY